MSRGGSGRGDTGGWFPPPSKPRQVEGGLKARSQRGAIAQHWWSARFIDVLESLGMDNRLARGRNYARRGQVLDLVIRPGMVTASVQGSRARPYKVRIGLPAFGKGEWNAICRELADNAWYAAKLLGGEMPEDIEDVFAAVGLSLFPASAAELSMDCSCPDWSVPCKHLAAVFYLLAEAFDADPFAILAWRGREREELLGAIHALRAGRVAADRDGGGGGGPGGGGHGGGRPLGDCLDSYFALQGELPRLVRAEAPVDALLDQLPAVDLVVRGVPVAELLRPAYLRLAAGTVIAGGEVRPAPRI